MIARNLSLAVLSALLTAPAFGVTEPAAPTAPAAPAVNQEDAATFEPTVTTQADELDQADFDLDDDDVDVSDDQVTEADMNEEAEIVDTTLGAEQEAEESLTVEPKDDGQDVAQAAEEYLAKTQLKDAELAEAGPAPRARQIEVSIPTIEQEVAPEIAPARAPAAIAAALTVQPIDLKSSAVITKIQQALIAQGAAIEVDGKMGTRTKAALLEFQKRSGLAADGVVGQNTLEKLGVAR